MSEHFNVYVFTAGTLNYAAPIISFLNHKKKTITGLLHRGNCLETKNGFYIKDLRIIQNRELKDIIMIDNLAHSFGLQVNNGIPIL
jgi:CTD small phosphatase-like protein 2